MPKRKRASQADEESVGSQHQKPAQDLNHSVLGGLKDPSLNSRISVNDGTEETSVERFEIPFEGKAIVCEKRGGAGSPSLIFTHGAGGGLANPATRDYAIGFAMTLPILCFQGTMNLQSRVKTFHTTVEHFDIGPIALGGRSMGARAAVLTALHMDRKPSALVLGSYPLTTGKKGETREEKREQILLDLPKSVDVLFVVGSNDAQCSVELLREVIGKMKAKSWLLEIKGADHSMSLKNKEGVERIRLWSGAVSAHWLKERDRGRRYCSMSWNSSTSKVVRTGWKGLEDSEDKS